MYIVGIAGGSGSGKTTFAHKVLDKLGEKISILHMDSYYLPTPPESLKTPKGKQNFDHPQAFDWELLRTHLSELREGRAIDVPVYDFTISRRTSKTTTLDPKTGIILFEGIFSLYDEEIRSMLDIKCFLHVDSDIRFTRRLHRDVKERGRSLESVIEQYYDSVRPMYQKFLDPQRQYSDFVVGEETDVAADILSAKIETHFEKVYTNLPELQIFQNERMD